MHQSLVKFSESEASNHTPSLADFTTTTPELKFSVHTGLFLRASSWHKSLVGHGNVAKRWGSMTIDELGAFSRSWLGSSLRLACLTSTSIRPGPAAICTAAPGLIPLSSPAGKQTDPPNS